MEQEKLIGKKGKPIRTPAREIVANVMTFMEREAEQNAVVVPLKNFKRRVLEATGMSEKTYRAIKKETTAIATGQKPKFTTPRKQYPHPAPKITFDEGEEQAIRRIIYKFQVTEKRNPTLKGAGCGKTKDNRKLLMEFYDIRYKKIVNLKKLMQYRSGERPIFYIDETYINSDHTTPMQWYDDTDLGLRKPVAKERRHIIVHAGNEYGFVNNALLIVVNQVWGIGAEEWAAICQHVTKVEDEYIVREPMLDHYLEEFEFVVNTGSSDEEVFDVSSSEDDKDPYKLSAPTDPSPQPHFKIWELLLWNNLPSAV
ncbi:hypothetical protein TcasGA2_TC004507 [Tribolium castaneum]|uniref:Uncharacterized protein n=1 Tax=Tribolium castaneum TaxID=7070 RepID=D6WCD4_TRICA|nr:hypothetical protein TcasGA2_TC004507 [Tribolium castaneum]